MADLADTPAATECVLRPALERFAGTIPDKVFATFAGGDTWSYRELLGHVRSTAAGLRMLGVQQGDHVLVWLPIGRTCLRVWFAINYLGAVYVPINTAYRGTLLQHVVENSDAKLCVVHADLAPRLEEIDRARLRRAIVVNGDAPTIEGLVCLPAAALDGPAGDPLTLDRPIQPWDTQSILYTSGTTGPSKGVLSSYRHLHAMGAGFPLVTAEDRFLVNLPLFHAGGTGPVYWSLTRGGSIALLGSFATDTFWDSIRDTGTTTLILLGVMAGFVMKHDKGGRDAVPKLRSVCALPLNQDALDFGRRYGVPVTTIFNMTEVSSPLVTIDPAAPGVAGRPRPGIEVRIVDENDIAVPAGHVGELMVRSQEPWVMNHGYYKNPEATAKAWRNGWFHTGDAFRVGEDGQYFFVDRIKDAIRRRGENISSFEVEVEICTHPAIREAAAVAVGSEVAEDEVLLAVSVHHGQSIEPAALIEFLRERLAYFMVPRYLRIMDDLPKTPTQKVQKHLIRAEGVTGDTWDRQTAGIRIRRETLSDG